jgi:hypothetical protein
MEHLQTQGISLPRLGLGTFRMQGDACRTAVESALGLGYRHLDTAEMLAMRSRSAPRLPPPVLPARTCMSPQKSGMRTWRRMRSAGRSMHR